MKLKIVLTFGAIYILIGCAPKITSTLVEQSGKSKKEEVIHIYDLDETIPQNSIFKGDVKIGDTGLSTDCKYDKVISEAKKVARNANANIIKLIEVKRPSLVSSCYRIKAKLYSNENIQKEAVLPNTDYSVIHFYRPNIFFGAAIKFKIYDNQGQLIVAMKNNSKFTYKIQEFGEEIFWSPKVGRDSIKLKITKGKEYYVNCKMVQTFTGNLRQMELIRAEKGKKEFDLIEVVSKK